MEDKSKRTQVGFQMSMFKKNVIKGRASAKGSDMQTIFENLINRYFIENPISKFEEQTVSKI